MSTHDTQNKYKVRLKSAVHSRDIIVFQTSPDIIETRNVNYKTMDPIHMPGGIHVFASTSSRTFNISNIKMISRTPEEAAQTLRDLWLLRSWGLPYFGKSGEVIEEKQEQNRRKFEKGNFEASLDAGENLKSFGRKLLGAPPDVLKLYAYSDSKSDNRSDKYPTNLHNIPVVLINMSIPYPSDVDYIPAAGSGVPVPTIMTLDIQLTETRAPKEYSNFNLDDFKKGTLDRF